MQFSFNKVFIQTTYRQKWNSDEDHHLLKGVETCGKDWIAIVQNFFTNANGKINRTPTQCHRRYRRLTNTSHIEKHKSPKKRSSYSVNRLTFWSEKEDQKLFEGIRQFGTDWKQIADQYFFDSRTDRQCYDRYHKYWKKNKRYTIQDIQKKENFSSQVQISMQEIEKSKIGIPVKSMYQQSLIENCEENEEFFEEYDIDLEDETCEREAEKQSEQFNLSISSINCPTNDFDQYSSTHAESIAAMIKFWEKYENNNPTENTDLDDFSISSLNTSEEEIS